MFYCRQHPWVAISNGMFDGVCGVCEAEGEAGMMAHEREAEADDPFGCLWEGEREAINYFNPVTLREQRSRAGW